MLPIRVPKPSESAAPATMGFLDHLDELRRRLIYSVAALAAGVAIAFLFVGRLTDFVLGPTYRVLPAGTTLVFTRPGEMFAFDLDVALIGGVVLAMPFVVYQVWRFVAPALFANERRIVVPLILLSAVGTVAGAAFAHYVLFPAMMAFFGTFDSPRVRFMPRIEDTFDLYKNALLGMVVVFQMPTLTFFMARMHLVTAGFLWRNIKYAVLAIFVAAAVLTSSGDAWNQMVFAAPMLVLYVLSIGVAWLARPRGADQSAMSTPLRLVVGAMVVDHARRGPRR